MDSRKLALRCRELADNRKAENIVILEVRELSSVADYFVIASGTSEPHLRAIVDEITDQLREEEDLRPRAIDGTLHAGWIVLDYFDVLVHVMRQDVRERYDLETLWGDAPRVHGLEARDQRSEGGGRRAEAGLPADLSRQSVTTTEAQRRREVRGQRSEASLPRRSVAKAGVLRPEARKRKSEGGTSPRSTRSAAVAPKRRAGAP